ncbi:MAG: hypothetical protein AB7N91_10335 [Candidatus Tectimicrobiota bacterium]
MPSLLTPDSPRFIAVEVDDRYHFALQRGTLLAGDPITEFLAALLARCLTDPEFVARMLQQSGPAVLAAYLASRGFPEKMNLRVGDFGEVLAGVVLESEEALIQPILKLRYRETSTWAMRLTDVFSIRIEDDEITGLCFCSVKAGITPPPQNVALDGYDQLVKDFNRPKPEILFFTQERLWDARDFDQLERFDRVAALPAPVDRLYRLILIFDQEVWKESVIEQLHEHRTQDLPDFAAYLLLGTALRDTVSLCYALAQKKYLAW